MMKAAQARLKEEDFSLSALRWAHGLLCRPASEQTDLAGLLTELATAFDAQAVELRPLSEEAPRLRIGALDLGWQPPPDWLQRIQQSRLAFAVPLPHAGHALVTFIHMLDHPGWLLWLEDTCRSEWTQAEAGALTLAGQALERWLRSGERSARWVEQLERRRQQQRLEAAAGISRRLAHDLGNVFTGILGFTELSMGHPPPGAVLVQSYLKEIYRGAQTGARLTQQLRLFARRRQGNPGHCSLREILQDRMEQLQQTGERGGEICLAVPEQLPTVAIDPEQLEHVVAVLVSNAIEASAQESEVTLTAALVDVDPSCCQDYFGDLQPGIHVLLRITDRGPGMTAEQWRRVIVEPLFTTKPRHRGLGLASAYGILHAYRGGLRLQPRPEGGVEAEVLLPLAASDTVVLPSSGTTIKGKVLVVDDDPLVLNFVQTTLEQAGYRVQAVSNAADALRSYTAAHVEPFQLVLSDVLMPDVTGLDLARQLLNRDANVRLLFMTGHVSSDFCQQELVNRFDLLSKPFRPEGLLEAVRSAIDQRT